MTDLILNIKEPIASLVNYTLDTSILYAMKCSHFYRPTINLNIISLELCNLGSQLFLIYSNLLYYLPRYKEFIFVLLEGSPNKDVTLQIKNTKMAAE